MLVWQLLDACITSLLFTEHSLRVHIMQVTTSARLALLWRQGGGGPNKEVAGHSTLYQKHSRHACMATSRSLQSLTPFTQHALRVHIMPTAISTCLAPSLPNLTTGQGRLGTMHAVSNESSPNAALDAKLGQQPFDL